MKREQIIDIIIESLRSRGVLIASHKYQSGKAVQIKVEGKRYFNVFLCELKAGKDNIVKKLL